MTVKEIAEATGKDESTIRRWVRLTADKNASIYDKNNLSSPTYPSDYTKDEVLEILECGLGNQLVSILRANVDIETIDIVEPYHVKTPGFIYLARDQRSGYIKIGMTTHNLSTRLSTLKVANPWMDFIASSRVEFPREEEAKLHQAYRDKWLCGEWFMLTNKDIHDLVRAKNMQLFIEYKQEENQDDN